ncbi:dual specificity protein phosphatase family protein [Pandoraea aquatica]|nr:dual specificity protein phosphatase family protein [Pandoraea aquatica]
MIDQRPAATVQRKIGAIADSSPRGQSQSALAHLIDVSPRTRQHKAMTAVIDRGSSPEPPLAESSGDTVAASASDAGSPAAENGNGLPRQLKAGIEALSGVSMDGVEVHRNSSQPGQYDAHAYAQGHRIFLGAGQEHHLPHEAWHVVQQKQGRVVPTMQSGDTAINDDPALEQEADAMGDQAVQLAAKSRPSAEANPPRLLTATANAPIQRVLRITRSTVPQFTVLKYRHFQSLRKRYMKEGGPQLEIPTWLRLKAMAASKQVFEYNEWGDAIEAATGMSDQGMEAEAARHRRHDEYQAKASRGIGFINQFGTAKGNSGAAEAWYSPQALTALLAKDPMCQTYGDRLGDIIAMLPPGTSYNRTTLGSALYDINESMQGKVGHTKRTMVGTSWYTDPELITALQNDRNVKYRDGLLKYRGDRVKFGSMTELYATMLSNEAQAKRAALLKQREEEAKARRLEEAEQIRRRNARPTSMEAHIEKSEEIEQEIGKKAAKHETSLSAAQAMANQVTRFIDMYHEETSPETNLYARIGTDNRETSGAVGVVPETVREAVANGTLQEKLTHILNFRHIFEELLLGKNKEAALKVAKACNFNPKLLELVEKGEANKDFEGLQKLKEVSLTKERKPVTRNTQTIGELGIDFSPREQALWDDENVPEFGIGHTTVTPQRTELSWVDNTLRAGFPVKSGPSTHTYELFETFELLGIQNVPLESVKHAAIGYLLPIGAHSLQEIQHTAELFGADKQKSSALYGRTRRALQLGNALAGKTGGQVYAALRSATTGTPEQKLAEAHHTVLSNGYVFIGYHGTDSKAFDSILNTGFDENFEKRDKTDPWRGIYFAPTIGVAQGYLKKDTDRLLRVYAPAAVVATCVQARLPLDDILSHGELANRLKMKEFIPNKNDHIIVGRENSHADNETQANSLEAVLSWSAALQCIVLPSLHSNTGRSEHEDQMADDVRLSSVLAFETLHSSGGHQIDGAPGKERVDPAKWKPSEDNEAGTQWEAGKDDYLAKAPPGAPDRREIEVLRRLGLAVQFGMTWADVNAKSMPGQMNAWTISEMMSVVKDLPEDSPAWRDFVTKVVSARDHSEVLPGVYLSGWQSAVDKDWQKKHVKAALNCCQFKFDYAEGVTPAEVNVTGYSNGLFEWTSNWIADEHRKGLLVHCVEGKNRSATVLSAYIMKALRFDAMRAARFVMSRRPWAEPDIGALLNWEAYLLKLGHLTVASTLYPQSSDVQTTNSSTVKGTGKSSEKSEKTSGTTGVEPEWPGMQEAILASLSTEVSPLSPVGPGNTVGLNQYMALHDASGRGNNCLIYSIAGAMGQNPSHEEVARIGTLIRGERQVGGGYRGVGVEGNGFLNAQAVPRILTELNGTGRRVVLIDTTGRVESELVAGTPTYSAEIVNAGGGNTLYIINQRLIHFGWGVPNHAVADRVFRNEAGDGNRWIQFQ